MVTKKKNLIYNFLKLAPLVLLYISVLNVIISVIISIIFVVILKFLSEIPELESLPSTFSYSSAVSIYFILLYTNAHLGPFPTTADAATQRGCISEAEKKEGESNQIVEFTREIKKYSMEYRLKIIEVIWKIVYSDGIVDIYETNLIRRISGLLYISDKDNGIIKNNVKNLLNKI